MNEAAHQTMELIAASREQAIGLAASYSDGFRISERSEQGYVLRRRGRNWLWVGISLLALAPVAPTLDDASAKVDKRIKRIVIRIV